MLRTVYRGCKLFLRPENDGSGTLVINANAILYLDKIATDYVRFFIEALNKPPILGGVENAVVRRVRRHYRVSAQDALKDWRQLHDQFMAVAEGVVCPFSDLAVNRVEPYSKEPVAPYRLDLALTYRCNNNCGHCYVGGSKEMPELTTDQWKEIITKAVEFGIPQLVFTGGESILRPDLPELLSHAEKLGVITGLITNGRALTAAKVKELADAGLDYLQITLESDDATIHDEMVGIKGAWQETVDGIKNALPHIYITTNSTITQQNKDRILPTIDFLHSIGVKKFGINAVIRAGRGTETAGVDPEELKEILTKVMDKTIANAQEFVWYTPTCYQQLNPVSMGLGIKSCSAARITLAVEPDGNVMPCQSYFQSMGNALTDDFVRIWQHPLGVKLRNHELAQPNCQHCDQFSLCGGGCPLEKGCHA
ncbi:MAG: radical SAM/SPASM domain-containing protein [Bacillota bacterium]